VKAFEEVKRLNDRIENQNVNEQKQVASELNRRVAERTRELAETNQELQHQVGLLQHLPVSAWTLKPDGTPEFVNRVWLEYSGQTLDFVRSHPEAWMTAVHPDDREIASMAFWDGIRAGQGFAMETRSLRALDGVYRWHLNQAVVLRDAEGKVLKFVGTTTDIDDQKRAEEALRASESNLRSVIDNIPGLVSTLGQNGETKLINRQILQYFGKTFDELRGWGLSDAIHPDDLPRIINLHAQSIKPGLSFGSEYRLRRIDGVYRWFQFRAEPVRDAAGHVNGWYVLATDIHDRKQAEEALRASEHKFASIINTIPTLAWSARPDGYCDFLNQGWLDFTGLSSEQAQDWGWSETVHPEDLYELAQCWKSAIASGSPVDTEARLRRFDGVYRWTLIRANPWRDESGSIVKWYGTNTDIDDRKRAEEALRASEANLRRVIDTIPTLSWCNLADGPNEFLSKSWHEFTGLSSEQAQGWGWSSAFHPDDLPPLMKRWQELLVLGQPGEIEARLRRHDGVYRWFLIRVAPFRDETGAILRWYGTSTDIHDRKLADEALRASENNLRGILDSIPGLVCTMDPDGTIQHLNQPLLEYFGKTSSGLKDWKMTDAVHPDDRLGVAEAYTHSISTGTPYEIEHRCRRADGVYRWFQVRASAVRGADGLITGWYVLLTDIDDRKRAEEALESNERNLTLIINTMPALVWSARPDGSADFFNQRWLDYTGLAQSEAHDWQWVKAFHPDDLDRVNDYWRSHILSGEPGEIEARLRRFDGTYRWFLLRGNPLRDESGNVLKWYGTNTDIDDRKRAEEELRVRELNLLQITETIPEMLWSASSDGAIEYCNGRFLDYTGVRPEQIMNDGWITLLHPDDVKPAVEIWKACVETGAPYRVEVRTFHAADRTYRWCVARALPLHDPHGRIVRWHGTVVDMHDWKKAQEELRSTQAELARMTRATTIGQLTASIAHEVSQPLSGIIMNANTCLRMLKSEPPNVDGARETVLRTIRDGNRASDVITRLRTLFSQKQIDLEPVNLNETAREVITLLAEELQKSGVILKYDFGDLPPVHGDRVQLQQVILNLIRNGSDAMDSINDRPRQLLVRTAFDENRVTVSVQDSGVGFSPEMSERLFDPFFTTKQQGMGIGLSVSRSIVEAHHGRLWADRNAGPGVTFAFSIPQDVETLQKDDA
jgi:PAS domain S-box-containing protein